MKEYFKNLWRAICGSNPFRKELDELKSKYEKTAADVSNLSVMCSTAIEKYNKAELLVIQFKTIADDMHSQLVEKDKIIERLNKQLKK